METEVAVVRGESSLRHLGAPGGLNVTVQGAGARKLKKQMQMVSFYKFEQNDVWFYQLRTLRNMILGFCFIIMYLLLDVICYVINFQ